MNVDVNQSFLYSLYLTPDPYDTFLRERAIYAYNCTILSSYDPLGYEDYTRDQIKVDTANNTLVHVSSYEISSLFKKYVTKMFDPLTKLEETTLILRQVCKTAFNFADGYGHYLSQTPSPFLIQAFKTAAFTAIFVFAGLKRMHRTYYRQYYRKLNHEGFTKLCELKSEVSVWDEKVKSVFCKVFRLTKPLVYSDRHLSVTWEQEGTIQSFGIKQLDPILHKDKEYYESLYTLARYDREETSDYSQHQIKAYLDSNLLHHTSSSWSNWFNSILSTPLSGTVSVMEKHLERARHECTVFHELIHADLTHHQILKDTLTETISSVREKVISGVKRVEKTYMKKYNSSSPNHPGLKELRTLSSQLSWADEMELAKEEEMI